MDLSGLFERFQARYPFPFDDFQVEACRAIAAGQSVIVSAPTGAGKTLVAEFAIQAALETGKRIAYTTPLKALSNQKFGDFTRAFGADAVGILTGDVKVNPHGRVLVMTRTRPWGLTFTSPVRMPTASAPNARVKSPNFWL